MCQHPKQSEVRVIGFEESIGIGHLDFCHLVAASYAMQLTAVGADPSDRVPADPPLVLLHAAKTDLKAASTCPAELLLLAAAVTLVSFHNTLPIDLGYLTFFHRI
jgi:hypothetical protein